MVVRDEEVDFGEMGSVFDEQGEEFGTLGGKAAGEMRVFDVREEVREECGTA